MTVFITDSFLVPQGSGGGSVAYHEAKVHLSLGEPKAVISGNDVPAFEGKIRWYINDPESYGIPRSQYTVDYLSEIFMERLPDPWKAVFFNGSGFRQCAMMAKNGYDGGVDDAKIIADCPAHDLKESIKEHILLQGSYPYRNLTDPFLFGISTAHLQLADLIICPSEIAKRNLLALEGFKTEAQIVVIPHGCNLPIVWEPPRDDGVFTVLYVSAIAPDKGLTYLMAAWNILAYPPDQAQLVIVGWSENQELRTKTGAKIQCLSRVSEQELDNLYNSCDCLVAPSVTEGYGLSILESMSHARPVIVSRGAGASEIVQDGGTLFDPRDTTMLAHLIDSLKLNPKDGEYQGSRARVQAEKYSWDKIEEQYRTAIRSVIE